jgi:3-methyladenine DNA glycosylase AlkD
MTTSDVLKWLEARGSKRNVLGMARYGITARRAFGVPMSTLQSLGKRLGTDHDLAQELWATGWHEARLLAALVDDPQRVTGRQMDAWARAFESWADCDTVCFKLFDRTPLAWEKARRWTASPRELVKRGGFALMACLALHDKAAPDERFLAFLPLVEKGARDERNFVKKGVSWALRAIGRRSPALHAAALRVAGRLLRSEQASCRWVGGDAQRDLARVLARGQGKPASKGRARRA